MNEDGTGWYSIIPTANVYLRMPSSGKYYHADDLEENNIIYGKSILGYNGTNEANMPYDVITTQEMNGKIKVSNNGRVYKYVGSDVSKYTTNSLYQVVVDEGNVYPRIRKLSQEQEIADLMSGTITRFTIPHETTIIRPYFFYNCNKLHFVEFGGGELEDNLVSLTEIGEYAFSGCTKLDISNGTLPDNIEKIGSGAFQNCSENLAFLTLPSAVTIVPDYLCEGCSNLGEVVLAEGTTEIGYASFRDCISLHNINFEDGLEIIDDYAFNNCEKLVDIDIPESVTEIGKYAFYVTTTTYKKTIRLHSSMPPTLKNTTAFYRGAIEKIIVPSGSLETYLEDTNWNYYESFMEEE
jgi:hypothetical protein